MAQIYHDNGAAFGNRTRVFRECENGKGVEWMYAVDWAAGHRRWYGFGMSADNSIESLKSDGMFLSRIEDATFQTA